MGSQTIRERRSRAAVTPLPRRDLIDERARARASFYMERIQPVIEPFAAPLRELAAEDAIARMRGAEFLSAAHEAGVDEVIARMGELAAAELVAADVRLGAIDFRRDDSSAIAHAIDSTAVAIALGRELCFDDARLTRLAIGCLTRDIGLLLVDPALIAQPGRLEPAQMARVREHPRLGYELLRQLRPGAAVANQIAYQHHERQDGTGYPRGLRGADGTGRGDRSTPTDLNAVILEAEIAAVADVFVALLRRRSFRGPLSLPRAVATLRRLAGSQLNGELVDTLIALLPTGPSGACAAAGAIYPTLRSVAPRLVCLVGGRAEPELLRVAA